MIELTSADGQKLSAYMVEPKSAPRGAVVVLQEIFGVNSHIKKLVDDFAEQGYVAIAPALFDRVKPDVALGYDEAATAEGIDLKAKISPEVALKDIQAAVDAVKFAGKVAVVGYCWGGYLAYRAANEVTGLACAIGYYGAGIVEEARPKRKIPTLLHFAEEDKLINFEEVSLFRQNTPWVGAFSYPGVDHGFNCDERGSYNAEAAALAKERTLFWISQYVEGQPPIQLKNAGSYAQARPDKKKKKAAPAGGDDMGPPMD